MEHEQHILESGQVLRTHPRGNCFGQWCAIHSQMPGPWSSWPRLWEENSGLLKRQCLCGVGHPVAEMYDYVIVNDQGWILAHECCGCPCSPYDLPEWGRKEGLTGDPMAPSLRELVQDVDDLLIDVGLLYNTFVDEPDVLKRVIKFLTTLRDLTKEK